MEKLYRLDYFVYDKIFFQFLIIVHFICSVVNISDFFPLLQKMKARDVGTHKVRYLAFFLSVSAILRSHKYLLLLFKHIRKYFNVCRKRFREGYKKDLKYFFSTFSGFIQEYFLMDRFIEFILLVYMFIEDPFEYFWLRNCLFYVFFLR